MKKIKMTAIVLCASMLAGTAGCQATDKPDITMSNDEDGVAHWLKVNCIG
jgi:uncharacterized protein YaeQ